jgi:hypothetical protein
MRRASFQPPHASSGSDGETFAPVRMLTRLRKKSSGWSKWQNSGVPKCIPTARRSRIARLIASLILRRPSRGTFSAACYAWRFGEIVARASACSVRFSRRLPVRRAAVLGDSLLVECVQKYRWLCGARLQACSIDSHVDVLGSAPAGSLRNRKSNVDTNVDAARLEARATSESGYIEATDNVHCE